MRVIERQGSPEDEHFTEGEPDLEAPEELAVLEVDEEALLEEDLDNQVDLEDEVDEVALEISLDHLVHDGDDADPGDGADDPQTSGAPVAAALDDLEVEDLDDLEVEDLEDLEESLDRILREKLAGDEDPESDPEAVPGAPTGAGDGKVPACGPDEFVCRSCFLVRSTTQATGPSTSLCHDCSG